MKIAVSLPDQVFEDAEDLAARLGLNRSQLYARALEVLLEREGDDPVTRKLDELADHADGTGITTGRALIESGLWEW